MSVRFVDRAKILMEHSFGGLSIHVEIRNEVALVALNVFKVLTKNSSKVSSHAWAIGLYLWVGRGKLVHHAFDQLALRLFTATISNGAINALRMRVAASSTTALASPVLRPWPAS